MATAQEYATWIVQNKDLQGTPEFETVAKAYEVKKQSENLATTTAQLAPKPKEAGIVEKLIGAGETGLAITTGLFGGTLGGLRGGVGFAAQQAREGKIRDPLATRGLEQAIVQGAQDFTYMPRTEAGQEQTQAVGRFIGETIPPVIPVIGAPSMLAQATRQAAPFVEANIRRGATAAQEMAMIPVQRGTQMVRDVFGMETPTVAGATGRTSGGAMATGGELQRMTTAKNLPVEVDLTLGAARRDAEQLAFEKEQMKGQLGQPLRQRAEENNLQILQNFDAIVDLTGAEQTRSGLAATGNSVINALSTGYEGAKAKTRAAYKKAESQGELDVLLNIDDLATYINSKKVESALQNAPIINFAKDKGVELGVLEKLPDGSVQALPTTLKNTEALRRSINEVTGYEPTNRLFSGELKKLIDQGTEGLGGELYKQARTLREQQARKYEGRAIVANLLTTVKGKDDPKIVASEAFQKSILNASPEEITFLKRVLLTSGKDGQQAFKELQGATIKHLEDISTAGVGTDSQGRALVSTAKLNSAINQLDSNGRLDIILGKKNAEIVRDLNEVAKYVTTVPPGTLVNNSGTAGVLLAAMGEAATTGALTGLPLPAISILRAVNQQMKNNKTKARIAQALNKAETSQ
jgi:hypothetical protein